MSSSSVFAIALLSALVSCGDPSKPLKPDGSARPRATTATTLAQPSGSTAIAPSSAGALSSAEAEDPACKKSDVERLGAWRASPAEVRAAIAKTNFCAPRKWLADTLAKCMQRLGQLEVSVRYGVMDGDGFTPNACDISVGAADWNGRRWITFNSDIREGHTYFEYVSSMELTATGPKLSTRGCQRAPNGDIMGMEPPLIPPGWAGFPDKLKARLCF